MKKKTGFLMLICIMIFLAACGKNGLSAGPRGNEETEDLQQSTAPLSSQTEKQETE